MIIFFQELIMLLFLWMLKMIDGIMEIFSAISGISKVDYNGEQVNIIEFAIGHLTVSIIFWCVFILAAGLCCIFAIASLIKNMVVNNKNISAIFGKLFLSLLGTMAMLSVVILGIMISNSALSLVSGIFETGNTAKLSNALFSACVEEWVNGYSVAELDISSLTVKDIFGDYNTTFYVFPTSWKGNGMVNPNTFMYLPAMIASVGLVISLIVAVVNLAKRVYEIVFLYLIMPISMSTLSLDDGARFKAWRETFISKIVLAYGTVFSVNIFILLLPLISHMRIPGVSDFANSMFLIFMIIGGAMVIPAGQAMFVRLFGSSDDMHVGGSFLRSAFNSSRVAGLMTIAFASKILKGSFTAGRKLLHKNHKSDSDKYFDSKKVASLGEDKAEDKDKTDNGGEEG